MPEKEDYKKIRTHYAHALTIPLQSRITLTLHSGRVLKSALAEENDLMNASNKAKPELEERYGQTRKRVFMLVNSPIR